MTKTTNQTPFLDLQDALGKRYVERDTEISLSLNAVLADKNFIMIGPPGSAKSQIINDMAGAFGARYFHLLMDRMTTKEDLFGPPDLGQLREGKYRRVPDGMVQEARIAFFDEIFKTSSAASNTLLTIINEKRFKDGAQWINAPLIAAFAASNELPAEKEELAAFWDRFLLRKFVSYIMEAGSFIKMIRRTADNPIPEISREQLDIARIEVANVSFPPFAENLLVDIRTDLDLSGVLVSDRRWKQSIDVIKSTAWLHGRDAVIDEDFQILQHVLWQTPADVKPVMRVILNHANPLQVRVVGFLDILDEIDKDLRTIVRALQTDPTPDKKKEANEQGIEWWGKVLGIAKELKQLHKDGKRAGRDVGIVKEAMNRAQAVALKIGSDAMQLRSIESFMQKYEQMRLEED